MLCPNCSAQNPEESDTCYSCGQNLKLADPKAWLERTMAAKQVKGQEAAPVVISPAAIARLKELLKTEDPNDGLRLNAVKGGGKFGTIYGMYIDSRDNAKPIDEIFDFEGMKVYINSPSLELLNGATLDYVGQPDAPVFRHLEDFKITNPNDPPRAVDIEVKQSEDEEEDRALYCPRCGWVVISNEEMVGFPCTHQPACEHVQYVFDDFNNEFLYLSDELDERISALRQAAEDKEDEFGDGEFSDFDWAFEEGPKEFDTLQRTDEGMACGPVAYTVVVGFERGEVSNRKRHVVTKPKRQQMTGHAPETEDIDIGRGKAVTEEFLALHQKDYYPCPENRKAIMDWFNTAGLLDEWTLANLEDCFRQLSTAGKLIAPAEAK